MSERDPLTEPDLMMEPGSASEPDVITKARVGTEPDVATAQRVLPDDEVRGERPAASIGRRHTLQSRASHILAGGLCMLLGIGALIWYYASAASRSSVARHGERAIKNGQEQAEMTLPPLGRIDAPRLQDSPGAAIQPSASGTPVVPGTPAAAGPSGTLGVSGVAAGSAAPIAPGGLSEPSPADRWEAPGPHRMGSPTAAANPTVSPRQRAFDRRLSGAVFVRSAADTTDGVPFGTGRVDGAAPSVADAPFAAHSSSAGSSASAWGAGSGGGSGLAWGVGSTGDAGSTGDGTSARGAASAWGAGSTSAIPGGPNEPAQARVLPTQKFLLPKGAFIDCTLETAIDSSLPGMTTCVTATDTFSVDGSVVLLERGTKLVGETRGEVHQGATRVFVLWTEARTPTGVTVPLDSPGTDELGRSGLSGSIDRHFWERFGAAILITTIDGAVQSAVQSSARDSGTVVLNPSGSTEILTETLKGTVNIPPTISKKNGDRIQVLVARDVDFRSVYDLRAVTAR